MSAPLCGGGDGYWNLFMCYTYEQLNSLAVDPWRGIAFKTVSVNWFVEDGIPYDTSISPIETNFLFSSDISNGVPLLHYQIKQSEGVYMGLQFDVDSSRLVGLAIPGAPPTFFYKLVVIAIETMDLGNPQILTFTYDIFTDPISRLNIFAQGGSESSDYALGSIVSGIISKAGIDTYVFTVPYNPGGTNAQPLTLLLRARSGASH
jgi:hypothetical protein